jgi:tetratricopeptide (TPR) repeat protein
MRMARLRLNILCFVFAVAGAPVSALAYPSANDLKNAEIAFQRGMGFAEAGAWSEALLQFERAGAVDLTPQIRYHIARCHAALGHFRQATGGLRLAIKQAQENPALAERLKNELEQVTQRTPTITVRCTDASAKASLDGTVVPIGEATLVDPGEHTLRCERDGASAERKFVTRERDRLTEMLTPEVAAIAVPPALQKVEAQKPETTPSRALPIALFAAGGALAAATVVSAVVRQNAISDLDSSCSPARVCGPDASDSIARGKLASVLMLVFGGAAIASIGAGVAFWVIPGSESKAGATWRYQF